MGVILKAQSDLCRTWELGSLISVLGDSKVDDSLSSLGDGISCPAVSCLDGICLFKSFKLQKFIIS